jgi:hypothetical protein
MVTEADRLDSLMVADAEPVEYSSFVAVKV